MMKIYDIKRTKYKESKSIKIILSYKKKYVTIQTMKENNNYKSYLFISDKNGFFILENKNILKNIKKISYDDCNLLMFESDNNIHNLNQYLKFCVND